MQPSLLKFLLSLCLLSLTACGGGGGGDDEQDPPADDPIEDPTPTPPQDQTIRMITAAATINESSLRTTRFASTDLNSQKLRSRTTVNVGGFGEEFGAKATGNAIFTARAESGSLYADIDWFVTLLSAINLSTKSEVTLNLSVREVNPNGSLGSEIFSRQLERDGIGSGLKAVEVLNVRDDIRRAYQLNLKEGQQYRVVVELECSLRVDILSLSLIDCNAESGERGVNVNELMIMYQ